MLSYTLHNLKYSFRYIFAYGNELDFSDFFFYTDNARISVYWFLYLAIFMYDSYSHSYLVNF